MKTIALFSMLLVGACASSIPLTDLRLPSNVSASNVWALLVAGSNGYDNYRHQVGWPVAHLHRPICLGRSAFDMLQTKCVKCSWPIECLVTNSASIMTTGEVDGHVCWTWSEGGSVYPCVVLAQHPLAWALHPLHIVDTRNRPISRWNLTSQ